MSEGVKRKKFMSTREVLTYSMSLFGLQAIIFYVNSYVAEFYNRQMGADLAVIGVLLLVAKVISAFFDPIVGNLIEKKNGGKRGKLKPFVLYSIIPLVLLTILMFIDFGLRGSGLLVVALIIFTLWSMAMTLGDVPSRAIAAVLTPDIEERTNMLAVSNTFMSIGQAAPYVVVPVIAFIIPGGLHGFDPGYMNSTEYLVSAIFIAIVGSFMLSLLVTNKERVPYTAEKMTFGDMWRALKGNKPLILVTVSYFLGFARQAAMAIQVQASTVIFGTPSKIIILGITTAAGTMISMALTPLLIKKLGEKVAFIGLSIYGALISVLTYFVTIWTNYNLIAMLGCLFLLGLQFGAVNVMPMIMVADCVDYYEHKTGKRTEGVAYAVLSLTIKVSLALGTAVALIAVSMFKYSEFIPELHSTSEMMSIKNGVFFTYTVIPGITSALAAIPIFFYDISGKKKKDISIQINMQREEKNDS